jgi:hypothetical protein
VLSAGINPIPLTVADAGTLSGQCKMFAVT